jgi:hypothetical protein
MESNPRQIPVRSGARIPLLLLLFLALAASRRREQLASPQVWCEDGQIIREFSSQGWSAFLQPLNGYLILIPRAITRLSLALSVYNYPIVSTVLAVLYSALIGVVVATAPTRLRARFLCAVSLYLVPSNAEVFGLPLYTLWWAPILLLVVALWDETKPALCLRLVSVVVGGLSSPFIIVVLPVLLARAFLFRRSRPERVVVCTAAAVAAIQAKFIFSGTSMAIPALASSLKHVVPKFCGWFLVGNLSDKGPLLCLCGALLIVLIAAFGVERRRDPSAWILLYLYLGSIGSSILRVDPAVLHPTMAGPRYFFFAFVLTFWVLIQCALSTEKRWLRYSAGAAGLLAVLNAVPVWSRRHDDLHWKEHIVSAPLFEEYALPIESDGNRLHAWWLFQSGEAWNDLLSGERLLSSYAMAERPTYAYRVVTSGTPGGFDRPIVGSAGSPLAGNSVLSVTYVGGHREVILKLEFGSRVRFRSGPVTDPQSMRIVGREGAFLPRLPITEGWVVLEFSNSRLPKSFTVEVEDNGQGVGEWSEVGH